MLQGYELWLVDKAGDRRFRAAAARDTADVLGEARAIMAGDPRVRRVDIALGGEHLFTLDSPHGGGGGPPNGSSAGSAG